MPEIYKGIVSPILDRLDSEIWQTRTKQALHLAEVSPFTLRLLELFAYQRARLTDPRLTIQLGGTVELDNPVVVAAGWDKSGRAVKALHALGFAGVEVGTVTAYPQPGNPKPRQFVIGPGVAINRLGFNNPGMEGMAKNLSKYETSGIPIGISIGKNKYVPDVAAPQMHALVADYLYDQADYFVVNVSSPNTPGLRRLQEIGPLTDIVQAVNSTMDTRGGRKPLFVKIAPDLARDAINDVIRVVADNGLKGIIATNTTVNADLKARYGERWANEAGGLSGDDADFRKMSTEIISHIYNETGGSMEIIGVGGVKDAATALEKIRAGARVVQVLTAIRGEGPTVVGRINQGLVNYMDQEGICSVTELVGIDHR